MKRAGLILFLLGAFSVPAPADLLTLKSGEQLQGRVTRETPDAVTINVQVSSGVTDEREISRAEIRGLYKDPPDEVAYQSIKDVEPGATTFTIAQYEEILESLKTFLRDYPTSVHCDEVVERIAAFDTERKNLAAGGFKLGAQWLTKQEIATHRYQVNAQILLNLMKQKASNSDLVGALNTFDDIEKSYPGSRAFPDAVELDRQVLSVLGGEAARRLQTLRYAVKERAKGLAITPEPEKSQLVAAAKKEQESYQAAFDRAKAQGLKWPPLIPESEKCLQTLLTDLPPEIQRLRLLPVKEMRASIHEVDTAILALQSGDPASARDHLKTASTLWTANYGVTFWTPRVTAAQAALAKANPPAVTPLAAGKR